ncbi:MAG: hypothetical protein IKX23_07195 [Treponema sp.]|nr:hypothetical protein [Treponema sp.]
MKAIKKVAAVLIFVLYSVSVFAQSLPVEEGQKAEKKVPVRITGVKNENGKYILKNKNGSGVQQNVINFTGFPLASYKPEEGIEIKDIVDKAADIMAESWSDNAEDYAVVGHSQGGLRALAYANVIKQKAEQETDPEMKAKYQKAYDHLGAVITVSGIDKGIKMLDGGFAVLKSRIMEDVNILYNGFSSVIHESLILGTTIDVILMIIGWIDGMPNFSDRKEIVNLLIGLIPDPEIRTYILMGLADVDPDEMKEIRDMMPYSNFIAENVADVKTETKKVDIGGEWCVEWKYYKKGWLKIPYLKNVYYPKYKVFTEYYEDKLKIDENIPTAYIVGMNNDMCSLFENPISIDMDNFFMNDFLHLKNTLETNYNIEIKDGCLKVGAEDVREGAVNTLKKLFDTAEMVHTAKTILIFGLLTNSVNYAKDARKASAWISNLDNEIYELLGSDENDCFVAKESQFYSRDAHPYVLSKDEKGYEEFPFNHGQINPETNKDVQEKIIELLEETAVKTKNLQ